MITFAVVGHNEAETLVAALEQASAAAAERDVVLFVDSASTDGSPGLAAAYGVQVLRAPLGKGRALSAALAACTTRYICFVDGDIHGSSVNIPLALGEAVRTAPATMIVGDFEDAAPGVLSNSLAVYEPLIRRFVPEAVDRFGDRPLTGFRVLDTTVGWGQLPPTFGVEAHMNIIAATSEGATVGIADIGTYEGRFLYKPTMGLEIARPILDWAQANGRLAEKDRSAWDAWVDVAVAHIATYRGEPELREAFRARLLELSSRPFPS